MTAYKFYFVSSAMGGRHSSLDSGPASVTAPPSPFSSGSSRHSGTASQTIDALDPFDRYPEPLLTSRDYHTDHRPSLHTPSTVLSSGQRRFGPRVPHHYTRNSTGGNSSDGPRSGNSLHSHSPIPPFTGPANDSGAREVFSDPINDSSSSHFHSFRALSDNHIPNAVSGEQGTNSEEPHNNDSLRTLQILFASSALSDSSTVGSSPHTVEPATPADFIDPLGVLAPPSVAERAAELTPSAAAQSTAVRTRASLSTSGLRLVPPEERPPRVSLTSRLPLASARRPRPQSHSLAMDAASGADAAAPTSRSMFSAFRRVKVSSASSSAAAASSSGASSSLSAAVVTRASASASSAASASGATGRTPRDMRTRRLWEALGMGSSGAGSGGSRHTAESSTSSEEGDEAEAGEEHGGAHPFSMLPFLNLPVAGAPLLCALSSCSSVRMRNALILRNVRLQLALVTLFPFGYRSDADALGHI